MTSTLALVIRCINRQYLSYSNCVFYDLYQPSRKSNVLAKLKAWNTAEFLFFYLGNEGIDVQDSEVLTFVANMLKTRKFKAFFLAVENTKKKYSAPELLQIENILIKNVPRKTKIILYSFSPSTDAYSDWLQKLNTTFRVDYSVFEDFFYQLSDTNQSKILQSFQDPNCRVQGVDFNLFYSSSQVNLILQFFSEKQHKLKLMRLETSLDISATVFETAAKTAAANKILPEGIHWAKNYRNQLLVFKFLIHQVNKTKIKRVINNDIGVPYGRSKLMFIGQGRAGKTSTIKTLMRKGFDPKEESTRGFDIKMVQVDKWKEKADPNYMPEFLQCAISDAKFESEIESIPVDERISEVDHITKNEATLTDDRVMRSSKDMKIDNHDNSVDAPEGVAFKPEVSDEEIKNYGEIISNRESKLGFSIWDFGGQEVFYSLHHLFLTEYGCYVLVFDLEKVNSSETREESLECLKFWLFSKKIHAPSAPVIIVGTHSSGFDFNARTEISDLITARVLGHNTFNDFMNGRLCFFPIDNMIAEGIDDLRKVIEKVVEAQSYVTKPVPISFLRVLDHLLELNVDYVALEEVNEIMERCGLSRDKFEEALDFLNTRGLLNYFKEPVELKNFVVLQPQWMVNGLTCIIFDENEHDPPDFDQSFNRIFRRFLNNRVISGDLLSNIWNRKDYSAEVQTFFKFLMLKSNVMCEFNFLDSKVYFVPSLFSPANSAQALLKSSAFTGQHFVIDFSGAYNKDMVKDNGVRYVRYLPYGLFERLVCLCVAHSSELEEKFKPIISRASAILSFGNEFKYELRLCENPEKQRLWIKIIIDRERKASQAMNLVKTVYSMISALKNQYFSSKNSVSVLAISLLVPSDKGVLADYENIKARRERKKNEAFWPSSTSELVKPSDFNFWFNENTSESLTNPNLPYERLSKKDDSLSVLASMPSRPLPEGLEYHCFLSYETNSAIDLVGKQYYILANHGFKCWYDMQFRQGAMNLETVQFDLEFKLKNMQEGMKRSMVYCLHLSDGIFPVERKPGETYYIDEEVKMALLLEKPIMFLTHPDTGTIGHWSFWDYIKNAPEELKPHFIENESIQLRRRYYEEEPATLRIVNKLIKILKQSLKK